MVQNPGRLAYYRHQPTSVSRITSIGEVGDNSNACGHEQAVISPQLKESSKGGDTAIHPPNNDVKIRGWMM